MQSKQSFAWEHCCLLYTSCDHGDGIRLGEHVFVNANCTFLDGGYITIGAHTLVGPCVQIYTPQHPMDYVERRTPKEYAYPVTIGEDCWIGGGAVICPGVTIGDRDVYKRQL